MSLWWKEILTRHGPRTERGKRLALGAVLAMIGVVTLTEVVLVPGAIIRRPEPAPLPANMADRNSADELHPTVKLVDSIFESSESKARRIREHDESLRDDLRRRVRGDQQALAGEITAANREWNDLVASVRTHYQVDLTAVPYDSKSQPHTLNQLILTDATVATAWSSLRALPSNVQSTIRDASAQADDGRQRLESNTFNETDSPHLQAALGSVKSIRQQIRQGRVDLDHINVMCGASKFLSRTKERSDP